MLIVRIGATHINAYALPLSVGAHRFVLQAGVMRPAWKQRFQADLMGRRACGRPLALRDMDTLADVSRRRQIDGAQRGDGFLRRRDVLSADQRGDRAG